MKGAVDARRMRPMLARLALGVLTVCLNAHAADAGDAAARVYEAKDCEQPDSNLLALRACTALLESGSLDDATREGYRVRRGFAWLADEDGAEGAIEDFTRALQINPSDVKALEGRAKAHTLLGAHVEAAADWSAIIASNPDKQATEAALMERGRAELSAGRHAAALADFANALDLNPKSEQAHIARANVYAALGERAKVLEEYDAAHAINGGSLDVYLWRAQMAERWGETQSAIENYTAALKKDPRKAWEARKSLKRLGIDSPSE